MKNLLKLQVISFISRIIAMFSGIFQSLIIVNLLSVREFGLIGLVTSIAGIAGITQHLGLASSSTKEISNAKNSNEVINIVLASLSIRFLITFPVALILFFFAPQIANYYQNPDLIFPLKIFGAVTIIQAFQSIFNSVISGTQRFKELFTYQVVISFVSILVYVPLIYIYRLDGFFYSLVLFNLIQTIVLGILAFRNVSLNFVLPSKSDFFKLVKTLLKVSLAIYLVKILFTAWQEMPVVILGKQYPLEMLALFTFAFNFSSKLMSISDSVTDVNLPVYSKKFQDKDFFNHFNSNFNVLFHFIFFVGISAAYWSKEILQGADYFIFKVGSVLNMSLNKNIYDRYQDALILFLPLILSIVFYSFLNILKSSIFIPLEKLRQMMLTYLILIVSSFISYLISINLLGGLISMSVSLAIGAFAAFIYSVLFILRNYQVNIFNQSKVLFSALSISVGYLAVYFSDMGLIEKSLVYLTYFILLTFIFKVNVIKLILKRK
jgi:O-antigen/teichoic acid export membrane protein